MNFHLASSGSSRLPLHSSLVTSSIKEQRQHPIKIIAGSSHLDLANSIAKKLNVSLCKVLTLYQSNGETTISFGESVRDCDVYIVQSAFSPSTSTSPSSSSNATFTSTCHNYHGNVNNCLMELMIAAYGCRISSAYRITFIIPCFPYSRQDKKDTRARVPISARLISKLLETSAGNNARIVSMDLHAWEIEGFFRMAPMDNLSAEPIIVEAIQNDLYSKELVIVSPDAGGVKRVTTLAEGLGLDFAIIHKERRIANEVNKMVLVGDVKQRPTLIVDDMADTCGTLCMAAEVLKSEGALMIYAIIIHPILSDNAIDRIISSPISKLYVVNTLDTKWLNSKSDKIKVLDASSLFAEAIRRLHCGGESISFLFHHRSMSIGGISQEEKS